MKNYYHILGVASDVSEHQLRQAYLQRCKQYHPDKNGGADWAQERLKLINEAYETLSDPMQRLQYNKQFKIQKENAQAAIKATRAKVKDTAPRVDMTDVVDTSSRLFRPLLTLALAFVFFIVAVLLFERKTPKKAKQQPTQVSYSEQAYESERERFLKFCKEHPSVLSQQEFDALLEEPIEPGFTYVLNRLLVQGDTSDIHYLIQTKFRGK